VLHFNNISKQTHGPSFCKFNASLAEDDHLITLVNESMPICLDEFNTITNKRLLWDLIKYRIQQVSMEYGKEKARKRREKVTDIEASLKTVRRKLCTIPIR